MGTAYDAIVVGARCAGAPTAMLLARRGYRVLLLDRATFPSDTLSTHIVHPPGVAALARWGLAERLAATGCPPIHTYAFDFGPLTIAGTPGLEAAPLAYCPRRTVLDKLLVEAAMEAGAEFRENFDVEEIMIENGRVVGIRGRTEEGAPVSERAAVVIGADGRNSLLARAVGAEEYDVKPPLLVSYYAYWSGLPMNGRFEIYVRSHRGFGAAETHDGLTVIVVGWPIAEREANRDDVEGHYHRTLELAPDFAERLRGARRETRLHGAVLRNFFRKPCGAGWVLVGDAAYHKDSITAQGITDAFLEAEHCTAALDAAFTGARNFDDAMAAYHRERDERVRSMYDFTCELATLAPSPPEMQELLGAIHGRPEAMSAFARMFAGAVSPAEFFAPQNVGALMAAA